MGFESNALAADLCRGKFGLLAHSKTAPIVQGACPRNRRIAIPARAGNFWHSSIGIPHVAVEPAYLTKMVLRGFAPQRRAKNHAAMRGGSEMPRLLCCRISQTHYLEAARSSAAHTGHFRSIAIPAITRTGSWGWQKCAVKYPHRCRQGRLESSEWRCRRHYETGEGSAP